MPAGYQQDAVAIDSEFRLASHPNGISTNPCRLLKGAMISLMLPMVNWNILQHTGGEGDSPPRSRMSSTIGSTDSELSSMTDKTAIANASSQ